MSSCWISVCRSQPSGHPVPSVVLLLFLSALLHELSGLASAAVVIGAGGIGAGTGLAFNPLIGSIQPVKAVEITNRNCDLNALSRVQDDRYCDKYFVCSNGKYVGLFCPLGMAFDYGLQECRLKQQVDCSRRPLFGGEMIPFVTSTTTSEPTATISLPEEPVTTPETMTSPPIIETTSRSPPLVLPPPHEHMRTTTAMPSVEKIMTLPFGARVVIPFGSTILLPPGSQIEIQQPPVQSGQWPHQHQGGGGGGETQHAGHKHRRASTSAEGIAAIVGGQSPVLKDNKDETTIGDDDGTHQQTVESDQMANDAEAADSADVDYYYEDEEEVVDDGGEEAAGPQGKNVPLAVEE